MKMKLKIAHIICWFLVLSQSAISKSFTDSLELELKNATDTNKIDILNKLSTAYADNNGDKALEYAQLAIELSKPLKFDMGIIQAYNNIGIVFDVTGKYDSALINYNNSLVISKKINHTRLMANTLNNIGLVYWNKGELDLALNYYLQSLKLFEKIESKKGQANTLSNIGLIYTDFKKYNEALEYHFKSLKIREQMADSYGIGVSQSNIGMTYGYLQEIKKALEYLEKALETKQRNNDLYGQGITLSDIGIIYGGFKKYDLAIEYQLKALAIRTKLNDKLGVAKSYSMIASDYAKKKDHTSALQYNLKALEIANELHAKNRLKKVYYDISDNYKNLGDFQKALAFYSKYAKLNDTIFSEQSASKIAEMQTKYETEKKDLELTKTNLELSKKEIELNQQKNLRTILIISILAIIAIFYLLYTRYKFKQKSLLNQELLNQQMLRSKAIIEAEENERVRIARELHDGVGQYLSAVKLNLSNLQSTLQLSNEQEIKLMNNALTVIDESVKEVRAVSHNMMPGVLLEKGLELAVRNFIDRIRSEKLSIEFDIHLLSVKLESTVEIIVYRVIQEIVNNIIKHARATSVNIQLVQHEEELVLMVEDNGIGFDINSLKNPGIGIKNIRSRVEFLNGSVDIDSQPSKGTTITIEIPLKKLLSLNNA
jgi:two-component system NarL family sensor kinase